MPNATPQNSVRRLTIVPLCGIVGVMLTVRLSAAAKRACRQKRKNGTRQVESIDYRLFNELGTRAGGEPVSLP